MKEKEKEMKEKVFFIVFEGLYHLVKKIENSGHKLWDACFLIT